MGRGVVEELCKSGIHVDIGDIRVEEARRIAEQLKEHGKVDVVKVDINNREELARVVKNYDMVVNTIGPFYKYGYAVASSLVEAGVNFVDICDDHDAVDGILGLTEKAEERGVLGITGLGWTPGLSNLLAKKGYVELGGEVDAVDIWWFGSAADSKGLAVVMHLFYALTGDVPMYLGGKLTKVRAGSAPAYTEFPSVGRLKLYYTGHPEPITIPKSLSVSDRVVIRGCLIPQWQNGLAKLFIKLGLTSTREKIERLARTVHGVEGMFRIGGKPVSGVKVDVSRGKETLSYVAIDRMRRLTSIPAAIGAQMMLTGVIRGSGVHAPEKIIDASLFLRKVEERGIEIKAV